MTISEPMTLVTDWALALAGVWLGNRLWRDGESRGAWAPRLLALCFLAVAVGAFLGGAAHGFATGLGGAALARIWLATTALIGIAGFFLLAAAAQATLQGLARQALLALAGFQLGAYISWMTRHHEFYWVILNYGTALVVVAALVAGAAWRQGWRRSPAALWILAGIGLSVVGAAIQAAGLSPHRHFNHNDLFHVVQIVALFFFCRGGLQLEDAGGDRS